MNGQPEQHYNSVMCMIWDSALMQLSMQNYQAVFFTEINIGTFNILLQLTLDQIKVGFTPIDKIHADVKYSDIQ